MMTLDSSSQCPQSKSPQSKWPIWLGLTFAAVAVPCTIWAAEVSLSGQQKANTNPMQEQNACQQANAGSLQMRRMVTPGQKPASQVVSAACQPANISAM